MTEAELQIERRKLCNIHDERLDKLDRAVYGNGKPEEGILWMARQNFKKLQVIERISGGILVIVATNLFNKLAPEIAKWAAKL